MRIKSTWFKEGREHTPEELAGAIAFNVYRIADNALKHTRKADYAIEVGPQYFAFLDEFLVFLIQVADRIAYRRLSGEQRYVFTSALANHVAGTHAENESRLLNKELAACKQRFIDLLNQRAGEYAEFGYDEQGPDFSFMRYLGYCMDQVVSEKDNGWIIDQMMSIAAPEAVEFLEKAFRNLMETEPRPARRRAVATGD